MTRIAAVDVGTNTVRLIVTDDPEGEAVEREQRIARLGQGVDATSSLDPAAMDRTADAIARFVARARELGADPIRIAGTSALRDARNREAFRDLVRERTGHDIEVLDGRTEGRCAYAGAVGWMDEGAYVVCDIGGGSTELITANGEVSVDVGAVRLRERCVPSDPPQAAELEAARGTVRDAVEPVLPTIGLRGGERLVGVAGTITTLAALELGLEMYDRERVHGATIAFERVTDWSDRLGRMTVADVRALGVVAPGRADVLVTGVLILAEVMRALSATEVIVSTRDILDGLVLDLAQRLA